MKKYNKLLVYSLAAVLIACFACIALYNPDPLAALDIGKAHLQTHQYAAMGFGPMICVVTLANISKPSVDNTGGIQTRFYYGLVSEVDTFPAMPAYSGTLAAMGTISDNIVMDNYKRLYEVYCTIEKGSISSEIQGGDDGQSFRTKFTFQLPTNSAESIGFLRALKNEEVFMIAAEFDNVKRLIGHPGYPARLRAATMSTGEGTAGEKMTTVTVESVWSGPAPIFAGIIDLTGTGYASGETYDQQTLVFVAD